MLKIKRKTTQTRSWTKKLTPKIKYEKKSTYED